MNQFLSIGLLAIFVVWLNYEISKNNKLSKKGSDAFWNKEAQANQIRKADISGLDYISIPVERLPMEDNPSQAINSYRDTILSLSKKKILNLSGFSNTELKLKYGTSNITQLTEYENNYNLLVTNLQKWGECLYVNGNHREALIVLEVAIACRTDVHKTFELLVKIYRDQNSYDKISLLEEKISSTNIRDKESLLSRLTDHSNSR